MLDFSHLPNALGGADVFVFHAFGENDWQTWVRPRGKGMAHFMAIAGGGGGGGGYSGPPGTPRGGGGGGASSGVACLTIPLMFLPDVLFINVARGGAGGTAGKDGNRASGPTIVALQPNGSLQNRVISGTYDGSLGGGDRGAEAKGGIGGYANSSADANTVGCLGTFVSTIGFRGADGGDVKSGETGKIIVWSYRGVPLSGGTGGGGVSSYDCEGGRIAGEGPMPSIAGGAGASRGKDGIFNFAPFSACGGTGGGSSNTGIGGAGGNGAIGCGGGGGGGGTGGGNGGNGGNGIVVITCW